MKRITILLIGLAVTTSWWCHSVAQERPRHHDYPAPKLNATLVGHKGQVLALTFSPNGKILATVSYEEKATRLWNTATGQPIAAVEGIIPDFSPDGQVLMTQTKKSVRLWDAVTGKPKLTLAGHDENITAAAFSPDSTRIATGSEDGKVRLWDAATGQMSLTLTVLRVKKLPRYRIISRALHVPENVLVKFSPDQQTVLTNIYWKNYPAKLWDAHNGRLQAELGGHSRIDYFNLPETVGVKDASFSPDGKFIATQSYGQVRLWDAATGKMLADYPSPFLVTTFSPDSKWLGPIGVDKDLGFLNLETLTVQRTSGEVDTGFLNQFAFSADSRTCVIGSGYKHYHATLIDVPSGRVTATIPLVAKWGFDFVSDYLNDSDALSFHPSSKFLFGANHGSVRFWDVMTGAQVWETTEARDPAEFSRDGKWLATVGKDKKTVMVWTIESN